MPPYDSLVNKFVLVSDKEFRQVKGQWFIYPLVLHVVVTDTILLQYQ